MFNFIIRTLVRQPLYFFLNLAGFGVGVACAFTALLYTWQESRTDDHFRDGARIYRIGSDFMNMGGFANGPQQLAPALLAGCPQLDGATHFKKYSSEKIIVNNRTFEEQEVLYVDSAFFELFDYPFIAGNPATVLRSSDQVVLSEELAHKYFGNEPALGKTLRAGEDGQLYEVAGVVGKKSDRSHLDGSMWLPVYPKLSSNAAEQWYSAAYYTYVRLRPGASVTDLNHALDRIIRQEIHPKHAADMPFDEWQKSENGFRWHVQPLRDIYFHSRLNFEVSGGGDRNRVYGFLLIGLFILLIGMFNYINLVTARAAKRAKEVGIRKSLGVRNVGLIRQFLSESAVFGVCAAGVAYMASEGVLSVFQSITGSPLVDLSRYRMEQTIGIPAFSMLMSMFAGVYPAFFLARFQPGSVLRGQWGIRGNKNLRSTLVVAQFSIAGVLMICGVTVYRQLDFMHRRDWGFEKNNICIIEGPDLLDNKAEAFRQEIARQSGVLATSLSGSVPAGSTMFFQTYQTPEMSREVSLKSYLVDADFVPTMGMRIVAGRNFDRNIPSDSTGVLLNEMAVKALGLGKDPIGREVNKGAHVIGVVSDFNYESLQQPIGPLTLEYSPAGYYVIARLNAATSASFIKTAEKIWQQFASDKPFSCFFLDEGLAEMSEKEAILGKALLFFTLLSIFIAGLGLFGLVAFTAEQRTKEIGIRKVLGASVGSIVTLLSKDFLKLIVLALLLASPVAYWAMNYWLADFAYRVDISWWIFVGVAFCIALIAFLTMSIQAVQAGLSNPVKALRSE